MPRSTESNSFVLEQYGSVHVTALDLAKDQLTEWPPFKVRMLALNCLLASSPPSIACKGD